MKSRWIGTIALAMTVGAGLMEAQELRIISAQYGHDRRWADVTQALRRSVVGGLLDVVISNQTFGLDPAPAEVKTLRIEYVINGRRMRDQFPENTRLVLPNHGGGGGGRPPFLGGGGGGFHVISAQYGAGNRFVDVTRVVRGYARDGQLSMRVNNDTMGGDPFRGADKVLRIEYEVNGQRDSVEVPEDRDLVLPRPGIGAGGPPPPPPVFDNRRGGRVVILSAVYGARDRFVDVSRIVRSRMGPDGFLRMPVTNDTMGGDPYRGPDKVLKVDYEFQGRTYHKEFREGTDAVLP